MTMRHAVWTTLLLGLHATATAGAQTGDERAVVAVVQRVFDGMRAADSAMVRSTFATGGRFAILDSRRGTAAIRYDSINGWLGALARSANRWNEQIYDVQTRVDADIAQVWAPYTFYLDNKVSHCGVNMFQLLRVAEGWKITQLSDSRRRDPCPNPLGT